MNFNNPEKQQESEKEFFNKVFASEKKSSYYSLGFTSIIYNCLMSKIGNLEGKKVVDFGCGEGWFTKKLANQGAEVWAFDISDEAVKKTIAMVENLNLQHRVHVDQMPAESLSYDSDSFDYVVGTAILHHTDFNASIKEIHRVLKKEGKAYFMEPLGHNFLLNWYRKKTPYSRSPDEKPLLFKDFKKIKKLFNKFDHEELYLLVLLALIWHFLVRSDRLMLKTRDILNKVDGLILRLFPFLKKYCWYTILIMEK